MRERKRRRSTAHVLLHQKHRAGRLEVEAARIEADALADERDLRRPHRTPAHIDETRLSRARASDGMNEGEVLCQEVVADDDGNVGSVTIRKNASNRFKISRSHIGCRRIDQIAPEPNGFCGVDDALRAIRRQAQLGAAAARFFVAVSREGISAKRPRERCKLRLR